MYGECKNEKGIPGNEYYYKLYGIINKSKGEGERGFGMLFSRENIASTCKTIARDYFIKDNVIIINFSNEDFELIKNGMNFLTLAQEKIQTIKNSITTNPKKHKLYRD